MAIYGTLAYVGTPSGINIVDITDPTHPAVLSTFGGSDVSGVGSVIQAPRRKTCTSPRSAACPSTAPMQLGGFASVVADFSWAGRSMSGQQAVNQFLAESDSLDWLLFCFTGPVLPSIKNP